MVAHFLPRHSKCYRPAFFLTRFSTARPSLDECNQLPQPSPCYSYAERLTTGVALFPQSCQTAHCFLCNNLSCL